MIVITERKDPRLGLGGLFYLVVVKTVREVIHRMERIIFVTDIVLE